MKLWIAILLVAGLGTALSVAILLLFPNTLQVSLVMVLVGTNLALISATVLLTTSQSTKMRINDKLMNIAIALYLLSAMLAVAIGLLFASYTAFYLPVLFTVTGTISRRFGARRAGSTKGSANTELIGIE